MFTLSTTHAEGGGNDREEKGDEGDPMLVDARNKAPQQIHQSRLAVGARRRIMVLGAAQ
jgi:hypothetical protein